MMPDLADELLQIRANRNFYVVVLGIRWHFELIIYIKNETANRKTARTTR